jgi:pre-rRNA-processing protein RIX1
MTHQYQSLSREITTPTLPTFVSSCLNLISSKSSTKASEVPLPLVETVIESFCVLVPEYPTIFRPFAGQVRSAIESYLAPTLCDRQYVTDSLSQSARRLAILLYQTAAKNTSGEMWGKGIRELVKEIHSTTDQVYRAVIENWESSAGYDNHPVDVNEEIHSRVRAEGGLPPWRGIDAGLERLAGLLKLLAEYLRYQTAVAVTIPLGIVADLLTRLMSTAPPSSLKESSQYGGMRLHPAIDRNEREALWSGLPSIHFASMEVYVILLQRLQDNFSPMAQSCLSQLALTYSPRVTGEDVRSVMYRLITMILRFCGSSLSKTSVEAMTPIIKGCCEDLRDMGQQDVMPKDQPSKRPANISSANADTFLCNKLNMQDSITKAYLSVSDAANELLPFLLSHLPQQHLQGYLRAEIDRTAILTQHKEAMLASVLNPFIEKNGKSMPSILPHLSREFVGDSAVDAFIRPRLPVLKQSQGFLQDQQSFEELQQDADDRMEDIVVAGTSPVQIGVHYSSKEGTTTIDDAFQQVENLRTTSKSGTDVWNLRPTDGEGTNEPRAPIIVNKQYISTSPRPKSPENTTTAPNTSALEADEDDSDESVHLVMDLSESEDETFS